MSDPCAIVRALLLEEGAEHISADSELRAHLSQCESCAELVRSVGELESGIRALPVVPVHARVFANVSRKILTEQGLQKLRNRNQKWLRVGVVIIALVLVSPASIVIKVWVGILSLMGAAIILATQRQFKGSGAFVTAALLGLSIKFLSYRGTSVSDSALLYQRTQSETAAAPQVLQEHTKTEAIRDVIDIAPAQAPLKQDRLNREISSDLGKDDQFFAPAPKMQALSGIQSDKGNADAPGDFAQQPAGSAVGFSMANKKELSDEQSKLRALDISNSPSAQGSGGKKDSARRYAGISDEPAAENERQISAEIEQNSSVATAVTNALSGQVVDDLESGAREEVVRAEGSQSDYKMPAEQSAAVWGKRTDKAKAAPALQKSLEGWTEGFEEADRRQRSFDRDSEDIRALKAGAIGGAVVARKESKAREPLSIEKRYKENLQTDASTGAELELGNAYLKERGRTTGLYFLEPQGYWYNSYLPGDPAVRQALAQFEMLAKRQPSISELGILSGLHKPIRPLDAPTTAALGISLSADRASLEPSGATRMLLQVGLRAIDKQTGTRPSLDVGIVLDLRSAQDGATLNGMQAFLEELSRLVQPGDRISVTLAGKPGGTVIQAEDFRFGTVSALMQELQGKSSEGHLLKGMNFSLEDAVSQGFKVLGVADETSLRTKQLVLLTGQSLRADSTRLSALVHEQSLVGNGLSVVGFGMNPDANSLGSLSSTGQGTRQFVQNGDDAKLAARTEISNLSKVVARALRLRVKLAPGVKLVNVVGSYRLDTQAAQRAKQVEVATDQRLAKALGIQADRGDDEDGVQILIPAFIAGDSHVVLFDVVASNTGNVAEATLKFKDLVFGSNGRAQAALSRERDASRLGHAEKSVLTNLLIAEDAQQLLAAADEQAKGQTQLALTRVRRRLQLLEGLSRPGAVLADVSEIGAEKQMLTACLNLLMRSLGDSSLRDLGTAALKASGTKRTIGD